MFSVNTKTSNFLISGLPENREHSEEGYDRGAIPYIRMNSSPFGLKLAHSYCILTTINAQDCIAMS